MIKFDKIEEIKKKDELIDLYLKDLVMVQMTGDFDKFTDIVLKKNGMDSYLKEVESTSTTLKLFGGIVNKTVEAQFGNKYAFLRELVQNSLDSYGSGRRHVNIYTEKDDGHLVVRVRDYGVGMNFKSLLQDLLIPYNSAKEFDPTKIGEHGIGWYSVVDVSDFVRVISHTRGFEKGSQALIYKDKAYDWKAAVTAHSKNGFSNHANPYGTEVVAYIPDDKVTDEDLLENLYKYVGNVSDGEIYYDGRHINICFFDYHSRSKLKVYINKTFSLMRLYVSKSFLKDKGTIDINDPKNRYRYKNLSKLLYTQRGLYINEQSNPFNKESLHHILFSGLTDLGLHFWVDIPENAVLTKGRNNIIAEHAPIIESALYECFESLYLESIITDATLLDHASNLMMENIANLFNVAYEKDLISFEKNKYSFSRRIMSVVSIFMRGFSDVSLQLSTFMREILKTFSMALSAVPGESKKIIYDIPVSVKYGFLLLSVISMGFLALIIKYKIPFGFIVELLLVAGRCLLVGALVFVLGFCVLKVYEFFRSFVLNFGSFLSAVRDKIKALKKIPSPFGLFKLGGYLIAGFILYVFKPRKTFEMPSLRVPDIKFIDILKFIIKPLGLFQNMEERKERKRQKLRKKISKRYLSKIYKNGFLKKVMGKEVIPAIHVYETNPEVANKKLKISFSFKEIFSEVLGFLSGNDTYDKKAFGPVYIDTYHANSKFEQKDIRLSIDGYIEASLKGSIRSIDNFRSGLAGIYVDMKNPIVYAIEQKMSVIRSNVRDRYSDVKLIEDYIGSFMSSFKKLLVGVISVGIFSSIMLFPFMTFALVIYGFDSFFGYEYEYSYYRGEPYKYTPGKFFFSIYILSFICSFYFIYASFFISKDKRGKNGTLKISNMILKYSWKALKKVFSISTLKFFLGIVVFLARFLNPLNVLIIFGMIYVGIKKVIGYIVDFILGSFHDIKIKWSSIKKEKKAGTPSSCAREKRGPIKWSKFFEDILGDTWIGSLIFVRDMSKKKFINIGPEELTYITDNLDGTAQAYIDELNCMEAVDALVADILDTKKFNFIYESSTGREFKIEKNTCYIDILHLNMVKGTPRAWHLFKFYKNKNTLLRYGAYLICLSVALRFKYVDTHDKVIEILDYIDQHGIRLDHILAKHINITEIYSIPAKELLGYYKMSRRKLKREKYAILDYHRPKEKKAIKWG